MTESRIDPRMIREAFQKAEEDFEPLFELDREGQSPLVLVGYYLERIGPTIDQILKESEAMVGLNPSAALVWSGLAFEMLAKEGICRPALFHRLGWDEETSDRVYDELFGRNGAHPAVKLLGSLIKVRLDEFPKWSNLVADKAGLIWKRNKIVHGEQKASSPEEAREMIGIVREFAEFVSTRCRSEIKSLEGVFENPVEL